ncbi:MAG: DUF1285 domain-containing protein [Paraglaciecola sp.]|nr:DUF1285 domain-containing protein [Paraglaciecola sp.]NCT47496.1 DUF1285 domain-containing protein [Paraglaciecola sp.]
MAEINLNSLQKNLAEQRASVAPIETWDPAFCGNIDMQIKHDGSWHYMGTPIGRQALVKLFAGVLKREEDAYFLVTPVEKVGIQVADSPFVITQWQQTDGQLLLTTNVDDTVRVSQSHPLALLSDRCSGQVLPYVLVRRNLWARLHQNVFYQLAEIGQIHEINGERHLTVESDGKRHSLGVC